MQNIPCKIQGLPVSTAATCVPADCTAAGAQKRERRGKSAKRSEKRETITMKMRGPKKAIVQSQNGAAKGRGCWESWGEVKREERDKHDQDEKMEGREQREEEREKRAETRRFQQGGMVEKRVSP